MKPEIRIKVVAETIYKDKFIRAEKQINMDHAKDYKGGAGEYVAFACDTVWRQVEDKIAEMDL